MIQVFSKKFLTLLLVGALGVWALFPEHRPSQSSSLMAEADSNQEIAFQLAATFRACRAFVAKNKDYIHKPGETINKDTIDKVIGKMRKQVQILYKTMTKKAYPADDGSKASEMRKKLEQSFEKVLTDYAAGKLELTWKGDNDYVKKWDNKLLPARFAANAAKNFNEATGGAISIKLTTSDKLLVNKNNAPDAWESEVIEQHFYNTSLKNQADPQSKDEATAYRYILPEYYARGCIKCHGGGDGEDGPKIHPNGEGRANLTFAGGISIVINK